TERNPAQPFGRNDSAQSLTIERKHLAQAGMKHQRLFAEHKKLVEREPRGRCDIRHEGRKPVNAIGDFRDLRFHRSLCKRVNIRGTAMCSELKSACQYS